MAEQWGDSNGNQLPAKPKPVTQFKSALLLPEQEAVPPQAVEAAFKAVIKEVFEPLGAKMNWQQYAFLYLQNQARLPLEVINIFKELKPLCTKEDRDLLIDMLTFCVNGKQDKVEQTKKRLQERTQARQVLKESAGVIEKLKGKVTIAEKRLADAAIRLAAVAGAKYTQAQMIEATKNYVETYQGLCNASAELGKNFTKPAIQNNPDLAKPYLPAAIKFSVIRPEEKAYKAITLSKNVPFTAEECANVIGLGKQFAVQARSYAYILTGANEFGRDFEMETQNEATRSQQSLKTNVAAAQREDMLQGNVNAEYQTVAAQAQAQMEALLKEYYGVQKSMYRNSAFAIRGLTLLRVRLAKISKTLDSLISFSDAKGGPLSRPQPRKQLNEAGIMDPDYRLVSQMAKYPALAQFFHDFIRSYQISAENMEETIIMNHPVLRQFQEEIGVFASLANPFVDSLKTLNEQVEQGAELGSAPFVESWIKAPAMKILGNLPNIEIVENFYKSFNGLNLDPKVQAKIKKSVAEIQRLKSEIGRVRKICEGCLTLEGEHTEILPALATIGADILTMELSMLGSVGLGAVTARLALPLVRQFAVQVLSRSAGGVLGNAISEYAIEGNDSAFNPKKLATNFGVACLFAGVLHENAKIVTLPLVRHFAGRVGAGTSALTRAIAPRLSAYINQAATLVPKQYAGGMAYVKEQILGESFFEVVEEAGSAFYFSYLADDPDRYKDLKIIADQAAKGKIKIFFDPSKPAELQRFFRDMGIEQEPAYVAQGKSGIFNFQGVEISLVALQEDLQIYTLLDSVEGRGIQRLCSIQNKDCRTYSFKNAPEKLADFFKNQAFLVNSTAAEVKIIDPKSDKIITFIKVA